MSPRETGRREPALLKLPSTAAVSVHQVSAAPLLAADAKVESMTATSCGRVAQTISSTEEMRAPRGLNRILTSLGRATPVGSTYQMADTEPSASAAVPIGSDSAQPAGLSYVVAPPVPKPGSTVPVASTRAIRARWLPEV